MALAGGVGAWLAIASDEAELMKATATAGVLAAVVLAGGLVFRFAPAVPIAVLVLAAAYTALVLRQVDGIDTRAPLVAVALFAVAELAYWSSELRGKVADEAGTYLRRAALLGFLLVGTVAAGMALLVLAEEVGAEGVAVELVGAAAIVGALALVAVAARRAPE